MIAQSIQLPPHYQLSNDPPVVGGAGLVFRALDLRGPRPVAIKVPRSDDPQGPDRLRREARIFQRLGPINGLVRYLESSPDGAYLALEWLQGMPLSDYIRRKPGEGWVLSLGRAVCGVLRQLHQRGVIHADLSLRNLFLLEGSQEIRLLDLGLAIAPGVPPLSEARVGTATVLAPEVGDVRPDERSDIYALGKVLQRVFQGSSPMARGERQAPSRAFLEVQEKCYAPDPEDRYQSVAELERALEGLQRLRRVRRASPVVMGGLLLGLLGVMFSWGRTPPVSPTLPVVVSQLPPSPPTPGPARLRAEAEDLLTRVRDETEQVTDGFLEVKGKKASPRRAEKRTPPLAVSAPATTGTESTPMEDVADAVEEIKKLASKPRTLVTPPERVVLEFKTK